MQISKEGRNTLNTDSEKIRPEILEIAKKLYDKHSNLMERLKDLWQNKGLFLTSEKSFLYFKILWFEYLW